METQLTRALIAKGLQPRPVLELTAPQTALLARIVDASPTGLEFVNSATVGLGDLLKLALDGLVTIPTGQTRAYATERGQAFSLRGAA